MKVHLMETHHEVYQDDHEWLDMLVDDDQNKLHFQVRFKLFGGVNGKNFGTNHSFLLHKYSYCYTLRIFFRPDLAYPREALELPVL